MRKAWARICGSHASASTDNIPGRAVGCRVTLRFLRPKQTASLAGCAPNPPYNARFFAITGIAGFTRMRQPATAPSWYPKAFFTPTVNSCAFPIFIPPQSFMLNRSCGTRTRRIRDWIITPERGNDKFHIQRRQPWNKPFLFEKR